MSGDNRGYRPVRDYALIGDSHTAALVSTDGSIDWCCWPRFDSPAVFCRLLDAGKGGYTQLRPVADFKATRSYASTSNVLQTEFTTDTGRVRVTDFMPVVERERDGRGEDIETKRQILRLVEGVSGEVELEISFRPTFDFARAETRLDAHEGGAVATAGRETVTIRCPASLRSDSQGALKCRFTLKEGERAWVALDYSDNARAEETTSRDSDYEDALRRTLDYWKRWWHTCRYEGPYSEHVRRSALTLKLLTYEPTGALVAAPTTSLPEELGGARNWDYRYTWLRDSSLILYTLLLLGYSEEAEDFFGWLNRLRVERREYVQIMYSLDGHAFLPERTLEHLEGYQGSRPVRVGNAAFRQMQLDIYGEVLDSVYLYHERLRQPLHKEWWDDVKFMADRTMEGWREPDQGIWELRDEPRHFLYSKLLCWVALDRAVRLARDMHDGGGNVEGWKHAREEIRRTILKEGYNKELGAFVQYFGGKALDASALIIPQTGFLPPTDARVRSTVERIRERLTSKGLVYRYLNDDGLPGGEATFALCSFWLVDNLALQGRVDDARELFERVVGYASDLGHLSEEIDPTTGELLGNYPQGFSHLALIRSALNIARAEKKGARDLARTSAQHAEDMEQTGQFKPPRADSRDR